MMGSYWRVSMLERDVRRACPFREIDLAVCLGWASPRARLLSSPISTCLPVTPRMSHSVPGQSPQGYHLLLDADHPLAPGWSLVWLSPGAQRGTLQTVIEFPNSACFFVIAIHSDADLPIKVALSPAHLMLLSFWLLV